MYAFPSGHTMTTTTFVTAVALVLCTTVLRDRGRVAVVLAAAVYAGLMGLSRVYLGVHWPGDVAGGWLLGAAFALASWALFVAPDAEGASAGAAPSARRACPRRGPARRSSPGPRRALRLGQHAHGRRRAAGIDGDVAAGLRRARRSRGAGGTARPLPPLRGDERRRLGL